MFSDTSAALVRLTDAVTVALGAAVPTEFPLYRISLDPSGYMLADYRNPDGSLTRYALPPGSVLYAKQQLTAAVVNGPPGQQPTITPAPGSGGTSPVIS